MSEQFFPVFSTDELAPGESKAVEIEGHDILVCNANGDFYAIQNMCTHQRAKMEGGRIRNCFISCPLHGQRFDLRDGSTKGQLTRIPLKTYPVRINDGQVEVAV